MSPQQSPPGQPNPMLAGRIQGFGNVNPPPLPEEDAKAIAKRAAGRLGDMVGEELALTVQDFKEKGAVGAVKDAVFDAGDILVDGVSSVFGWLRGDPPPEEEVDEEKSQAAQDVLTHAPSGAAYGVSQASPTGGINAVWVMPHEADPAMLQQLAAQASAAPSNIQPYQGNQSQSKAPPPYVPQMPMQIPGGPVIAPYDPNARSGAPPGIMPFVPGGPQGMPGMPGGAAPFVPGGYGGQAFPSAGAGGAGRVRTLIEQVAQGSTIVGPEVAKRLLSTCSSAQVSADQLAETYCERVRRIYLGLDSVPDSDGALANLLALADALVQTDAPMARAALKKITGVEEELLSLQSSAKHRHAAEPMLRRLGLMSAAESVDLLGDSSARPAPGAQVDLLDVGQPTTSGTTDLLGF